MICSRRKIQRKVSEQGEAMRCCLERIKNRLQRSLYHENLLGIRRRIKERMKKRKISDGKERKEKLILSIIL